MTLKEMVNTNSVQSSDLGADDVFFGIVHR